MDTVTDAHLVKLHHYDKFGLLMRLSWMETRLVLWHKGDLSLYKHICIGQVLKHATHFVSLHLMLGIALGVGSLVCS